MKKYAVTGHRPDKLFTSFPYSMENYEKLRKFAQMVVQQLPKDAVVISGMALGWDMAIAEACTDLGIPFIAYVPCRGQENVWRDDRWKSKYHALLALAMEVKILEEKYTYGCMNRRNAAMSDDCDELISLWNGDLKGGTFDCIKYHTTTHPHKKVTNFWKAWLLERGD